MYIQPFSIIPAGICNVMQMLKVSNAKSLLPRQELLQRHTQDCTYQTLREANVLNARTNE